MEMNRKKCQVETGLLITVLTLIQLMVIFLLEINFNLLCVSLQPWEGRVLGKKRNGDSILQNVHIIPIIGKGG